METLRRIIQGHLPTVWVILLLTLCMKLVVPVGFMPDLSEHGIALIVCDGMAPSAAAQATPGMHGHHHHHGHDGPTKPDAPCPFAGLSAPVLGGADPIQLARALADILAAGLVVAIAVRLRTVGYLRPPLRGPPRIA